MSVARRTTVTAIAAAAISLVLLSGCAATQSKHDACNVVVKQLNSSTSELQSAYGDIQNDPTKAQASLKKFGSELQSTTDKLTNPEVKKASQKAADAVDDLQAKVGQLAKDPSGDTTAVQDSANKLQDTFRSLQKTCTA